MLTLCCCSEGGDLTICATVRTCAGAVVSGAAVSVTGPGGFSGSCATGADGKCCVTVPARGTYTVSSTLNGVLMADLVVLADPATTVGTTLYVPPTTPAKVCVRVVRCGATVTGSVAISVPGYTVDGSGCITLGATPSWPINGTVTYTDDDGSVKTKPFSVRVGNVCGGNPVTVDITSNMVCVVVKGCADMPLSGASVSAASGACTTDAEGRCCLTGTPGSPVGTVTIIAYGYQTKTIDGGSFGCGGTGATLDVAAGFICCCDCQTPDRFPLNGSSGK